MNTAEIPRGASTVDNELEVGYDERFESRWRHIELFSHATMLVIVVICASGLLGRGPLSHSIESSADGALNVDYEPIARHGTSTQITVHVATRFISSLLTALRPGDAQSPRTAELFVSSAFAEPMGLQDIIPRPVSSVAGSAGVTYLFLLDSAGSDAMVRFVLKPNAIGPIALRASCRGSVVAWKQWVMP
jgi:hypothetical protein